jgi:NAD(P)-dependent dehydrogenase (short-subunit alcohol dehydrogenase family)
MAHPNRGFWGMTRALAAEWSRAIRVTAIGTGYFRTDLTEVFNQNPTWCVAMLKKIPAGRFGAARGSDRRHRVPVLGRSALCHRPAALHRRRLHGVDVKGTVQNPSE